MGKPPAQAVSSAFDHAKTRWPEFELHPDRFAAFVVERADSLSDEVARLRLDDLYLACACLDGNEQAINVLEQRYVAPLVKTLRRLSLSDPAVEEIQQQLRHGLIVGTADKPPKLASYAGRGRLSGWVSVIAVRMALKHKRQREVPVEAKLLEEMPTPSEDPELDHLRRQYREPFRDAVQRAFDVLSVRQRNLLQQHYIDGLTTYQLAGLYRVNQSTATRWLARARQAVLEGTRATLQDVLQLGVGELDSLMRDVRSQLEITMRARR